MEKTFVSTYVLGIKYSRGKQEQTAIPTSAYSSTSGFDSGTSWKPLSIIVNRTSDNNKFEYSVYGIVEWKLLGARIFSQEKEYDGSVMIK